MHVNIGTEISAPITITRAEYESGSASLATSFIPRDKPSPPMNFANMDAITKRLDQIFGSVDGSYFIINQSPVYDKARAIYGFYIEDKDNERHVIYFEIV